jgi:hypothetical protein
MLIIDRPPTLLIHIRRTAGKSIASALRSEAILDHPCLPPHGISHETVEEFVERVGESTFREFRSFCLVRHPLDRFISQFRFMKSRSDKLPFMQEIADITDFMAAIDKGLSVCVKRKAGRNLKAANYQKSLTTIMQPQSNYTRLGSRGIAVTHVFRYEELGHNWDWICKKLALPCRPLPWTHKSPTSEIADIDVVSHYVAKYYRDDFDLFGYEPIARGRSDV